MVKPNGCQVEAIHKVATEWYSGCRLVWVKLDGSRNTSIPLRGNLVNHVNLAFLRFHLAKYI